MAPIYFLKIIHVVPGHTETNERREKYGKKMEAVRRYNYKEVQILFFQQRKKDVKILQKMETDRN